MWERVTRQKTAILRKRAIQYQTTNHEQRAMKGSELKTLRYKLNLSLSQASRQVEVSVSTWCRWESGKANIPLGAVKLFKLLNKVKS